LIYKPRPLTKYLGNAASKAGFVKLLINNCCKFSSRCIVTFQLGCFQCMV